MSRWQKRHAPKPTILMYHRIADPAVDPWQLAVAPDHFEEQLAVLNEVCEPLAIIDFVDLLEKGRLPANAVAITFDDGYADNLECAKPRLERASVPATVFITTGSIGAAREFWWDELARLILNHVGDLNSEIVIAGKCLRLTLPASADVPNLPRWDHWPPRTEREALYLMMCKELRPLAGIERERAMSCLRAMVSSSPVDLESLPMTASQVAELAAGGLIEVGAHSVTHPKLAALAPGDSRSEIALSKSRCEQLVGASVEGFAYPFGDFDDNTRANVIDAGFRFACSTVARSVEVDRYDLFALPRLHARNCGAEEFERTLVGNSEGSVGAKWNPLGRLADLVSHPWRLLQ